MLADDKWHSVVAESFMLGQYTYTGPEGQRGYVTEQICPLGFQFSEPVYTAPASPPSATRQISGPLSAVLAVRYADE